MHVATSWGADSSAATSPMAGSDVGRNENCSQSDRPVERGARLEPLPLAKIYLLTPRPSMPPGEVIARGERPGGGRMDFAWLVFNHGHSGPPELRWLHRDRSGT